MQLDPGIELPSYAHPGDAGADLRTTEDFELHPGERRLVGTGIAIALPDGYAAFVHPRSGLAARHGVSIVNTPGTVDAGYRGEIKVCLVNTDREPPYGSPAATGSPSSWSSRSAQPGSSRRPRWTRHHAGLVVTGRRAEYWAVLQRIELYRAECYRAGSTKQPRVTDMSGPGEIG